MQVVVLPDDSNTCENEANPRVPDNGEKHIKAMGYVFVQWKKKKRKDLKDNNKFNPWNFWEIRGTYYNTFQAQIQDARKDIYF